VITSRVCSSSCPVGSAVVVVVVVVVVEIREAGR
jgi:hypothetical protein